MRGSRRSAAIALAALGAALVLGFVLTRSGSPGAASGFLGRLHPLLVHLPIGFVAALVLVECFGPPGRAGAVLLASACVTSVLAALAGFLLAWEGGYDADLLDRHLWLGMTTAALCLAAAGLRLATSRRGPYLVSLASCLAVLVWTGHDGASLTHGPGYLTASLAGERDAAPEAAPDFDRDIVPILHAKCLPCHGPDKQDGKFRVDVPRDLLEGGESLRPAVLPGDLSGSQIVEMVALPRNHERAMPPREAAALSRGEMRRLIHWIQEGAPGLEAGSPD